MVTKTEQAKILEAVAKAEGITVEQLMLREHRIALAVDLGRYVFYRGTKNAQGHKVRFCYGSLGPYFDHYVVWQETVVRSRGPNKKYSRTRFLVCGSAKEGDALCQRRRKAWNLKMWRATHGNEA